MKRVRTFGKQTEGEFVQWSVDSGAAPEPFNMTGTREPGTMEAYSTLQVPRCRSFNCLHVAGDRLIKKPIDRQGERLAEFKRAWYEKGMGNHLEFIPKIDSLWQTPVLHTVSVGSS